MTVKMFCSFVLLFQEILFHVTLSLVYIPVCRQLILLPAAVIHFPLNWRKMGQVPVMGYGRGWHVSSTKTAIKRINSINKVSVTNFPMGCHW